MNWFKNGGFIVKGGRSTTAGRGRAAIEHHHLAILRSIDGDSARGAVSRSVSLYLGRGGNNVWSDFRGSPAPMSRSRDSLSRALDDRQHRSTLASQSNFVGQRDSIPFIAIYIYISLSSHQSRLLFILALRHQDQAWSFLFFRVRSMILLSLLLSSFLLFSRQYSRRDILFNAKPQNFASRRNDCLHDECLEWIDSILSH